MEELDSLTYLKSETEKNIKIIKAKVNKNKQKIFVINVLSLTFSALITLTLGLEIKGSEIFQKNIALILGALLTIVNGINLLFNYKKLWIRQRKTLLNLYQLENKINFLFSSKSFSNNAVEELFNEYLLIWDNDSSDWLNIYNKKK